MELIIIGEAAAHIPAEVMGRHPTVPWPTIRAMRNKIVHEYFRLEVSILWKTATDDLPKHAAVAVEDLRDTEGGRELEAVRAIVEAETTDPGE